MSITKKQRLLMVAIVAIGLAAGGVVLAPQKHAPAGGARTCRRRPSTGRTRHAADEKHERKGRNSRSELANSRLANRAPPREAGVPRSPEHKEDPRTLKLNEAQAKAAAVDTAPAGPGTLQSAHDFQGEVRFNEDRTAHVVPRLAGVAESVPASLGQFVHRGQVLAVLASPAVSDLRSEYLAAQRRLEAARVTLERERKLWQQKISAEQDYLHAQSALRDAEIAVAERAAKLSGGWGVRQIRRPEPLRPARAVQWDGG